MDSVETSSTEEQIRFLSFSVKCYDEEGQTCMFFELLSERSTVGELKDKIHTTSGIPIDEQIIEGWFTPPENDDTILGVCADPINITHLIARSKITDDLNESLSTTTENEVLELESVGEFLKVFSLYVPYGVLSAHFCKLSDAIQTCTSMNKILLLYLHNKEDKSSSSLWKNLTNPKAVELLDEHFTILGWNTDESKFHDALHEALDDPFLSSAKEFISRKTTAILCIVPTGTSLRVHSCISGKSTNTNFLKVLQSAVTFVIENSRTAEIEDQVNANTRSREIQERLADMLGDRDYTSFEYDQHEYLKKDIMFALKGPPKSEGYGKKVEKEVESILAIIVKNSNKVSQHADKIEVSFIFNCLEPVKCTSPSTTVKPIFVIRKCHGSDNPCRFFVDHAAAVYETWEDYIKTVNLPKCKMVLPCRGRYEFDEDGKLLLEEHLSPSCSIGCAVLQGFDIGTAVTGVASTTALAVVAAIPALALPFVTIPLIVTSGIVGVYSVARGSSVIHNRRTHQQTISISNSEARSAYLNIFTGCLGFAGAGINVVIAKLIKEGVDIGRGVRLAVNIINITSATSGGVSAAHSGIDYLINKQKLTPDQLSATVLFFGHAIISIRTSATITEETQTKVLQDYENSLRSNRYRKILKELLLEETIHRNKGDVAKGKTVIVSTLRHIRSKAETVDVLMRVNEQIDREEIKFYAEGDQIKMNGVVINLAEFSTMNDKYIEVFLSSVPPRPDPTPDEIASVEKSLCNANFDTTDSRTMVVCVRLLNYFKESKDIIISLAAKLLTNLVQYHKILLKVFPKYGTVIFVIKIIIEFAVKATYYIDEFIDSVSPTFGEKFCKNMREYVAFGKDKLEIMEKFFKLLDEDKAAQEESLKLVLNYLWSWFASLKAKEFFNRKKEEKRNLHSAEKPVKKQVTCAKCGGYYFN